MDDLSKKKIEKISQIIDKVTGDFTEGLNRLDLDRLYERQGVLKRKINSNTDKITKSNARLQLQQVEQSIDILTGKIDIYKDINLDVDEESAKKYIEDNPNIFPEVVEDFDYE